MPRGLKKLEWCVVNALCEKQPRNISDLSKVIGRANKAVSDAVDNLDFAGYVTVETKDDEMGRPKAVSLTPKGKDLCAESYDHILDSMKAEKQNPRKG